MSTTHPEWWNEVADQYNTRMTELCQLIHIQNQWRGDAAYDSCCEKLDKLRPPKLSLGELTRFENWVKETYGWVRDSRKNCAGRVPEFLSQRIQIKENQWHAAMAYAREQLPCWCHTPGELENKAREYLKRV